MKDKKPKNKLKGENYNTVDGIDGYERRVIAANASRRMPFMGN